MRSSSALHSQRQRPDRWEQPGGAAVEGEKGKLNETGEQKHGEETSVITLGVGSCCLQFNTDTDAGAY